jgi:hypothetical protein
MEKLIDYQDMLIQEKHNNDIQNFIITDLKKVSQITLNKNTAQDVTEFIIKNISYNGERRAYIDNIINICNIKKIFYLNDDIISAINKLDLYIEDKEKDEFHTIQNFSDEQKKLILDLYIELENLIAATKLDQDTIAKLNRLHIFPNDNNNHLILGGNPNTVPTSILVKYKSPNELDIIIKNNSWERQKYLKNLQE